MARYDILFTEAFYQSLRSIPKKDVVRILRRSKDLADDPRPPGCQKLTGQEQYRIRPGDYRIIYSVEDEKLLIIVVKAGHRRAVYER